MLKNTFLVIALVLLAGCGATAQPTAPDASHEEQPSAPKGYISTMAHVNKTARANIATATEAQNAALHDALGVLDEDTQKINSHTTQPMDTTTTPQEIDMTLAQTCTSAQVTTNKGVINLAFYNDKAPVAVANFCTLAKNGFYNGVTFHRVIKDFMIQGGDPTGTGTGGPGYRFDDELPTAGAYKIGSLAMANAGPNTNGSQFFIVSGPAGVSLPPLYTLFGEVTSSMDVIDAIQNVATTPADKPLEDIVIESVELTTEEAH